MALLCVKAEFQRMKNGPGLDEKPGGIGTVRFVAHCSGSAADVLEKAASVLKTVDEIALERWRTEDEWPSELPEWFTSACAPSMTQEEAQQWLDWWKTLSAEEQTRAENEKDCCRISGGHRVVCRTIRSSNRPL